MEGRRDEEEEEEEEGKVSCVTAAVSECSFRTNQVPVLGPKFASKR
jgi:hypothetical protein